MFVGEASRWLQRLLGRKLSSEYLISLRLIQLRTVMYVVLIAASTKAGGVYGSEQPWWYIIYGVGLTIMILQVADRYLANQLLVCL